MWQRAQPATCGCFPLSVGTAWYNQLPAPPLPAEVAEQTSEKYQQAYRAITGKQL